jgi:hypothetical protein
MAMGLAFDDVEAGPDYRDNYHTFLVCLYKVEFKPIPENWGDTIPQELLAIRRRAAMYASY